MLWQYKPKLKSYLSSPTKRLDSVCDINKSFISKLNIKTLILDFDGVLNSHGENNLGPKEFSWLDAFVKDNKDIKIFILSNKPSNIRKYYFRKHFPNIIFVAGKRKKPYPDGLEQVTSLSGESNSNTIIIDDRLATGILAAEIFGCKASLITKPLTKFSKRPLIESFFCSLRFLEKLIINLIA